MGGVAVCWLFNRGRIRFMFRWLAAVTLTMFIVLGTAAPARAKTFTFTPPSAPPGASVQVNVSGAWVDTWFPEPGSLFLLADTVYFTVSFCDKKTNLLNQTRWVHCEFTVPGEAAPGPWTLRISVSHDAGSRAGPTADFNIESPAPASTTAPPTTAPPTTAPPTTTLPGTLATSENSVSTSTTQIAQNQSTTTEGVLIVTAGSDGSPDAGGPSWFTVALVAALAVALTVIVMQNLRRRQNTE